MLQQGEFFPPSFPFSKCPSTVQALSLADRDCCLQGIHLFLYQTGWFFLLYLNTTTVLSWSVVHSEAPAGVMLTAGSGSLSCEFLAFAHQHFIRDFGFFFRSVIKPNSSFMLALAGQIIHLLLFPEPVYFPSPACWCPFRGLSPSSTASPQPQHMIWRNEKYWLRRQSDEQMSKQQKRGPLSREGCCHRLCCKTAHWNWSPGGPVASEMDATKV